MSINNLMPSVTLSASGNAGPANSTLFEANLNASSGNHSGTATGTAGIDLNNFHPMCLVLSGPPQFIAPGGQFQTWSDIAHGGKPLEDTVNPNPVSFNPWGK